MLTARDTEIDRVIGLSVGADDYLIKPFFPSELAARVKAILRRPRSAVPGGSGERQFGDLRIDPQARRIWLDGTEVELSRIEYDILDALSENPGITLRRDQLLDRVWGMTGSVTTTSSMSTSRTCARSSATTRVMPVCPHDARVRISDGRRNRLLAVRAPAAAGGGC